jgi:signal transduction histidine kinase/CheY-like chemotaxis protein
MRLWLRRLSIKTKLIGMVMLASSVALLLACSAFLMYELNTYRDSAASDLNAIAQMIAGNSTAALAFADRNAAAETLNTLRGEAHIVEACIYRRDGVPLARYARNSRVSGIPEAPLSDGPRFEKGHLTLFRAVVLDGERVGTVYLKSDLEKMYARVTRYAYIAFAVLVASLFAAGLVSSILQRLISKPILDLADTASSVSRDGNYAIRAIKTAEDEIGTLVDRFNGMLAQIHSRDEALNAAKDELEDRVAERTRQLQSEIVERKIIERDLIAAKENAEASNKAKSVFLANMSHELRTPLNAIIGYSEMLEEDARESGQTDSIPDLRKIHGAGKHLLSLINDVLDLSKVEAGRMEVKRESFEIGQLVDEAVSTAEPLARRNRNRLVVECADRHAVMQADLIKFRQSLFNLLSNACKFTEDGEITLAVKQTSAEGQDWFDWEVSDTGIGIPADQMHKLFQSFSQVDSSTTRRHGGTGLGLAISQRLCQMMGGRITVESKPGAGSKFTIRLPAKPGHEGDEPEETGECERATVLAIGAASAAREWLERVLPASGVGVVPAATSKEGLERAAECTPALIVVDLRQPDMDGWALVRRLRSNPQLARTPILVHAGSESDSAALAPQQAPVERLVAICEDGLRNAANGPAAALRKTVESGYPAIFSAAAGLSALARIVRTDAGRTAVDLKITSEGAREFLEQLVLSKDWRRLSIVRLGAVDGGSEDLLKLVKTLDAASGVPASVKDMQP